MIRTVRVEYMRRRGTPGTLIAVADKKGRILYESKKAPPATKRKNFDEARRSNT